MGYTVEICSPSFRSAVAAQSGGADRIELCSELSLGGVTPSIGLVRQVRNSVSIAVNVLVRPRSGDFLYSSDEAETVLRDIYECASAGVQGIVVGALTADAGVDRDMCREWLAAARKAGLSATFHRAIDCAADIFSALEDVASLGFDRVLTSGGAPTAAEGVETIRKMHDMVSSAAGGRGRVTAIMAGSGINPGNIREIALRTGVEELHLSASVKCPSGMRRLSGIAEDAPVVHSDPMIVKAAVDALRQE